MSKQEATAKKVKKAKAQAGVIIQEAVESLSGPTGAQVKELRDTGMAWWAIGRELGLEGAGESAATGKKGASRARALYRKAFGEVPRSQAVRGTSKEARESNDTVRSMKKTSKDKRKEIVRSGKAFISEEMSDEDLIEAVRGRTIGWTSNLNDLDGKGDHYSEQEACVHPKTSITITIGPDDRRVLNFREYDKTAPLNVRAIPAGARSVRVAQIHTVR